MGSNPDELLGAQDRQPSFSSTSVSSLLLFDEIFPKFGSLGIGRNWQIYFSRSSWWAIKFSKLTGFGMEMFPKRLINPLAIPQCYRYNSQNWLVLHYFYEKTETGELQIW